MLNTKFFRLNSIFLSVRTHAVILSVHSCILCFFFSVFLFSLSLFISRCFGDIHIGITKFKFQSPDTSNHGPAQREPGISWRAASRSDGLHTGQWAEGGRFPCSPTMCVCSGGPHVGPCVWDFEGVYIYLLGPSALTRWSGWDQRQSKRLLFVEIAFIAVGLCLLCPF